MIRWLRHYLRKNEGSTSVEFAMVGVGFILMIISVIEIGRLTWTNTVVDYAIDEASRYASLHQDATSSDIERQAQAYLQNFFVPSESLQITVNNTEEGGVSFIEIQGNYVFTSITSSIFPETMSQLNFDILSRRPIYHYD